MGLISRLHIYRRACWVAELRFLRPDLQEQGEPRQLHCYHSWEDYAPEPQPCFRRSGDRRQVSSSRGRPKDFISNNYMGVQACPGTNWNVCRASQEAYEVGGPGSTYAIDLSPRKWEIAGNYRSNNNAHTLYGTR